MALITPGCGSIRRINPTATATATSGAGAWSENSDSGRQLLLPPANWCPIFALPDRAGVWAVAIAVNGVGPVTTAGGCLSASTLTRNIKVLDHHTP